MKIESTVNNDGSVCCAKTGMKRRNKTGISKSLCLIVRDYRPMGLIDPKGVNQTQNATGVYWQGTRIKAAGAHEPVPS